MANFQSPTKQDFNPKLMPRVKDKLHFTPNHFVDIRTSYPNYVVKYAFSSITYVFLDTSIPFSLILFFNSLPAAILLTLRWRQQPESGDRDGHLAI